MTKSGYVNAVIRSSKSNEAYFFINDKYVLLDYGVTGRSGGDKLLYAPTLVRDGFKSHAHTIFGSYGIDCAFDTDNNEAFIFYEKFCALIDYAPHSDKDKIISGPKKIADMFPFFKGTVFENGIDAAVRSTVGKEVHLFKGDKYARIDYGTNRLIQGILDITDGFEGFSGTIFEAGMDAAFATHTPNLAYIFKGDYYVAVSFTPGSSSNGTMLGPVARISKHWTALAALIPLKN
jgi:hypothetical protein